MTFMTDMVEACDLCTTINKKRYATTGASVDLCVVTAINGSDFVIYDPVLGRYLGDEDVESVRRLDAGARPMCSCKRSLTEDGYYCSQCYEELDR